MIWLVNSADSDQSAPDLCLHCLLKQFVKIFWLNTVLDFCCCCFSVVLFWFHAAATPLPLHYVLHMIVDEITPYAFL